MKWKLKQDLWFNNRLSSENLCDMWTQVSNGSSTNWDNSTSGTHITIQTIYEDILLQ